ncbi:MAG: hypothetical protein LV481_16375 [Methylacidiphilales bacterium]|nr:hypothetical protein [Candidatus Methylacidiphilales bacterium]
MKPDIFDTIAVYVPEAHRQDYWRMVARFRQLKPDDEILNIILAMGILTFLLRELPADLIEERKAWETQFHAFRAEMGKMMEGSTRQIVSAGNHVEAVNKAVEKGSVQFREGAAQIERASREAVLQIDIDGMAKKLTARVEERVVTRFETLSKTMEKRFDLMERVGEQARQTLEHLQSVHLGRMTATIAAIVVMVCGWTGLAVYWHLEDADKAALDDKLAQVEQMATANQDAFAALAVNNIKVEVADVIVDGQKQLGQKALRITPALDVQTETPDGQPKSGLISFAVPVTYQDQIERNQDEINRLWRNYNSK